MGIELEFGPELKLDEIDDHYPPYLRRYIFIVFSFFFVMNIITIIIANGLIRSSFGPFSNGRDSAFDSIPNTAEDLIDLSVELFFMIQFVLFVLMFYFYLYQFIMDLHHLADNPETLKLLGRGSNIDPKITGQNRFFYRRNGIPFHQIVVTAILLAFYLSDWTSALVDKVDSSVIFMLVFTTLLILTLTYSLFSYLEPQVITPYLNLIFAIVSPFLLVGIGEDPFDMDLVVLSLVVPLAVYSMIYKLLNPVTFYIEGVEERFVNST